MKTGFFTRMAYFCLLLLGMSGSASSFQEKEEIETFDLGELFHLKKGGTRTQKTTIEANGLKMPMVITKTCTGQETITVNKKEVDVWRFEEEGLVRGKLPTGKTVYFLRLTKKELIKYTWNARVKQYAKEDSGEEEIQMISGGQSSPECSKCDGVMVIRQGYSKFWGCSNYPRCRGTQPKKPAPLPQ